jgi:arginyl-tRNA synthetase
VRKGNVLPGVGLLDEVKKNIQEEFKVSEEIADVIAVGAVKYSFLKVEAQKGISFDIKESISVQGNSGPYLQYVYARIQSMVGQEKPGNIDEFASSSSLDLLTPEDILVLRKLAFFDEVVAESANSFSPHILCTYLYQLGQSFNSLYEKRSILKEEQPELKKMRIFIIQRVAETLRNGLELLGIRVLSKI